MNKKGYIKGQIVSEEIPIGASTLSIRAKEIFYINKVSYAIVITTGKKTFIHSTNKDLQCIMADFTKLVEDYRNMIKATKQK